MLSGLPVLKLRPSLGVEPGTTASILPMADKYGPSLTRAAVLEGMDTAQVLERFGAAVWNAGSYDPDLNLVYYGVGQTYDAATLLQPHDKKGESADGLYTNSTLALDPDTGKLAWHYQTTPHDHWDFDAVQKLVMADLTLGGRSRQLIGSGLDVARPPQHRGGAIDRRDARIALEPESQLLQRTQEIRIQRVPRGSLQPQFDDIERVRFLEVARILRHAFAGVDIGQHVHFKGKGRHHAGNAEQRGRSAQHQ